MRRAKLITALAGLAMASVAVPAAWAQGRPQPAAPASQTGCAASNQAAPATAPQPGKDGTAPGNAGSTGWSGGTGGSYIGTNPQGNGQQSATWQPPTARGLDPLKPRAERAC